MDALFGWGSVAVVGFFVLVVLGCITGACLRRRHADSEPLDVDWDEEPVPPTARSVRVPPRSP
jgi:hypothetical protein